MNANPNDRPLSPADVELERALVGLKPAAATIDERLAMFEAGRTVGEAAGGRAIRAAAGGSLFRWRAAAALLAVATGVSVTANVRMITSHTEIAVAPASSTAPPTVRATPTPAPPTPPTALPGGAFPTAWGQSAKANSTGDDRHAAAERRDLLSLRTIALADGIDALPTPAFGSAGRSLRVGDLGP